jgi:hypothetical protein
MKVKRLRSLRKIFISLNRSIRLSEMSPALKAYYIMRYLGPRIVWLRGGVYLRKRLGTTAKTFYPRPWAEIDLNTILQPGIPADPVAYAEYKKNHAPTFFFPLGNPPAIPVSIADAKHERQPSFNDRLSLLEKNRCVYFFKIPSPSPVDWHFNPLGNKRSDPTKIWCNLPDFSPEQGDMRVMWEPSRATWAIDLGRAKSWKQSVDAGELFWRWLESWMAACPPYMGFQWKCGQESSIRLFAAAFGFWALADEPAFTPDRWVQFARLAWATGYRVARHINYAISQKNNHALSEAMGLMLISRLFPEFREASSWWATGRRVLGIEIRRQIAPDGTYLQSSMNYHRVMLHVCILGLRLAELADEPFERDVYEKLDRAKEFIFQVMDPDGGRLPNYGSNDGAYVLPLSECDITDYRPVIQAVHYLVHRRRLLPPGAWDEDLLWLFGAEAFTKPEEPSREPVSSAFNEGGYYTLRHKNSWAMIRCHTYKDRMGQHDALHLDLWWLGLNVVQDCGSYLYYDPERPKVEHYFKSLASHNTIQIDDAEPLHNASRFLWLPWSRAKLRNFDTASSPIWFEGEHYDYDRAPWHIVHRRTIIGLEPDVWMVIDDIIGAGEHRATLRWHLMDVPFSPDASKPQVTLQTPKGSFNIAVASTTAPEAHGVARGLLTTERVQGFASPYYSELLPIPTLEVTYRASLPLRIITLMAPESALSLTRLSENSQGETWELMAGQRILVDLAPCARATSRTYLNIRSKR